MRGGRFIATLLAAALGAGCAELTADAPLFAPDAQTGPPPLTEGVWIGVSETCPAYNTRRTGRFPKACAPLDLRRQPDGAWVVRPRYDLVYDLTIAERADADDTPFRLVLAPAVERDLGDSYAPLYLAEARRVDAEDPGVGYAVIVPVGVMPATEAMIVGSIGCADILRDGPIDGIVGFYRRTAETPAVEGPQNIAPPSAEESEESMREVVTDCTASTQAAVREAARRAVIENLSNLHDTRYVYVRPQ